MSQFKQSFLAVISIIKIDETVFCRNKFISRAVSKMKLSKVLSEIYSSKALRTFPVKGRRLDVESSFLCNTQTL